MENRSTSTPFRVSGAVWIIAGGLTAAVTGPLNLADGSWAAAFAVLIGGVAQYVIGIVQDALASSPPTKRRVAAELASWNAGCVAVIVGTVLTMPIIVHAGGLSLVASLVLLILAVRGKAEPRWALWLYRALLVIILVSIPIGLTLAHVRAG